MKKKIWPGDIWEVLAHEHFLINSFRYFEGIGLATNQKLQRGDRFIILSVDNHTCLINLWGVQYRLPKSEFTRYNFKRIWCACPSPTINS